jgi:hypothetical protein
MNATPLWEQAVQKEALNFVAAVQQNFQHGLRVSLHCLPDQKDDHCRATQLDYFMDALVGVAVQQISIYGNDNEEMENNVVDAVKKKFSYIRSKRADADAAVAASAAEAKASMPQTVGETAQ